MNVELFPFQRKALLDIRMKTAEAMGSFHRTHAPQVVSFTAPTGAGKTIIMSSHIFEEVEHTCDRILCIKDGKLIADENVEDIKCKCYCGIG